MGNCLKQNTLSINSSIDSTNNPIDIIDIQVDNLSNVRESNEKCKNINTQYSEKEYIQQTDNNDNTSMENNVSIDTNNSEDEYNINSIPINKIIKSVDIINNLEQDKELTPVIHMKPITQVWTLYDREESIDLN